MRTITELRQHCKAVGNSFFSPGNTRYFGSNRHSGVYRAPYTPTNEGYIITETIFTGSNGVAAAPEYVVYRFDAGADFIDWSVIGKHPSKRHAVAFLQAMGAVKQ